MYTFQVKVYLHHIFACYILCKTRKSHFYVVSKTAELIEMQSGMVVASGWGPEENGEMLVKGYRLPALGKFWGSNTWHG